MIQFIFVAGLKLEGIPYHNNAGLGFDRTATKQSFPHYPPESIASFFAGVGRHLGDTIAGGGFAYGPLFWSVCKVTSSYCITQMPKDTLISGGGLVTRPS